MDTKKDNISEMRFVRLRMDSKTRAVSIDMKTNKVVSKTQVTTSLALSTTRYHKPKEIWVITLAVTTLEAVKGKPKEVHMEEIKELKEVLKRALKETLKKATLMGTRSTVKDTLRKVLKANPRQHLLKPHQQVPLRRHS